MELNGLANIRVILDIAKESNQVTEEIYGDLLNQAILMEKYMIALQHIPDLNWHEVREKPELFPTRQELLKLEPNTAYKIFLETRQV